MHSPKTQHRPFALLPFSQFLSDILIYTSFVSQKRLFEQCPLKTPHRELWRTQRNVDISRVRTNAYSVGVSVDLFLLVDAELAGAHIDEEEEATAVTSVLV